MLKLASVTSSLALVLAAALPCAAADGARDMLGYTASSAAAEVALEQRFDAALDPAHLREWLRQMSSQPNHLGSPHDKANADFVLQQFKDWGWDAHIETFDVLYATPTERVLELVAPTSFKATLDEPAIAEDSTSSVREHMLPPFNVYSADGDVTAELVYVNYGVPEDYKELERRGISVKGKIAIARYGQSWRGIKPKVAQEHGAIGCIIYSDPRDDGYFQGDAYPQGPFRSEQGAQRGSVADIPVYSGDPLTPGVGATKDAKRLKREDAPDLLKIPVLPISWGDALPLLKAMAGPVAPEHWRGALPITYHLGPGPAKVHLKLAFDWKLTPAYDVVATLRGGEHPDQWVLRGNHRDAWVFGASDPLSGQVALLEEARVLGGMTKNGWKPKRSIVYLSWDGEEPGLLGSTEWAETHADELKKKAVLYVNSDNNGRGFLEMGGSHSLEHVLDQIAGGITDPETGVSVLQRRRARFAVIGSEKDANPQQKEMAKAALDMQRDFPIEALGSGSDYTPFLQHLGIASVDFGYGGEDRSGDYHSVYDSFDHYVRFGDPKFEYGIALAKTVAHTVLRFADADVLPLRAGNFADTVAHYDEELHKLDDSERETAEKTNRLLADKAYQLAADPTQTLLPPPAPQAVPFLNFAPLDNAVARLQSSAAAFDRAYAAQLQADRPPDPAAAQKIDTLLQGLEQTLTQTAGLPGRAWYEHMIYAPGLYTGYGVKTLPGVREAIEQKHWDVAEKYVARVSTALDAYSARLDQARSLMPER
ncbi:MAG: transferrin receptor-like dimerization domain-containing protein [Rudaea sp.]|nr:transferrin receptor-like dimerization domain-containing protein [Rudaea sp.]